MPNGKDRGKDFGASVEQSLAQFASNDDVLPDIRPRSPAEALEPARAPKPPNEKSKHRMPPVLAVLNAMMTLLVILSLGVGGLFFYAKLQYDKTGPLDHSTVLVIPKGEGVNAIAGRLEREGVISDRRLFVASVFYFKAQNKLKYGEYQIRKNATMREVLDTLVEGRSILHDVTIPEGFTSWQVAERLNSNKVLKGEIAEIPPEGGLLPETYRFSRGSTRLEMIERMQAEQRKFLSKVWATRAPNLPFKSPREAVILASIVEKETGRADERDRVAAVFINRLRKGMRLQSDPTIIYGLSEGRGTLGRPILRSEIEGATPYNTYQVAGLPPTAISNPGRASVEAVLRPAKTDALYFVADGTGGHVFASRLAVHNQNVARWRVIEREIRAREKEGRLSAEKAAQVGDETAQVPVAGPLYPGMPSTSVPGIGPGAAIGSVGIQLGVPQFPTQMLDLTFQGLEPTAQEARYPSGPPAPLPTRNPRLR